MIARRQSGEASMQPIWLVCNCFEATWKPRCAPSVRAESLASYLVRRLLNLRVFGLVRVDGDGLLTAVKSA